jgi:uncharacterized protein YdhG (YjbR/CyaY superfamily)
MRSMLQSAALIEAWFDTLQPEQQEMARALRGLLVAAEPSLAQSIKWGNLMFTSGGRHALAIVIHKDHANLQVFNGLTLFERFPMLEGSGKGMRHLRLRYRQPLDEGLVEALAHACVQAMGDKNE